MLPSEPAWRDIARSAVSSNAAIVSPSCGKVAMPALSPQRKQPGRAEVEGLLHGLADLARDAACIVDRQRLQQHRELVAAEPGDQIAPRTTARSRSPICNSSRSPAAWPAVSLTALKAVGIQIEHAEGLALL